jgi:hypothetical protein
MTRSAQRSLAALPAGLARAMLDGLMGRLVRRAA